MTLLGPYLAACALLLVAGSAKVLRPQATARALSQLVGGRVSGAIVHAVRALAFLEAALGTLGALFPYRLPAALVGASYVGFAGFVLYVLGRGGVLATCGCFSTPDTPLTKLHATVDLALAAWAAVICIAAPQAPLPTLLSRQPLDGAPLLGACALCVWLVVLALVALPRLEQARQPFEQNADTGR